MATVSQHYGQQRKRFSQPARQHKPELGAPVVLMVSGGADSTALLLMACTGALDLDDGRGVARIARERLHVLHVNHHLRGAASDGDEAFVRDLCARHGLPLCVEHASFTELNGQNLEAAAREVRYAAARRYVRELSAEAGTPRSAARIVTAHTASDRAETFFMNAIKGSGAAGLSSIPRRRNIIVRPLLDRTHEELVRYLEVAGQTWREDESNRDTSYLRNFIRHRLMPLAEERNANVARTVGAACDILGDEDAFMSQLAAKALRSCVRRQEKGLVVLDAARLAAAEVAIARRMVRQAVKQLVPGARLEMRHVEEVLACVAAGEGSLTLPEGIDARIEFGTLALRTPLAREAVSAGWLSVPGRMPLENQTVLEAELVRIPAGADPVAMAREASAVDGGASSFAGASAVGVGSAGAGPTDDAAREVRSGSAASAEPAAATERSSDASPVDLVSCVLVDAASLGYVERDLLRLAEARDLDGATVVPAEALHARVWVDGPAAGDVMCPLGMRGRSKKLSDILNEAQVPVAERPQVPVVRTAPGGSIVWAAGIRLDDRFKCTATTRIALRLSMRGL